MWILMHNFYSSTQKRHWHLFGIGPTPLPSLNILSSHLVNFNHKRLPLYNAWQHERNVCGLYCTCTHYSQGGILIAIEDLMQFWNSMNFGEFGDSNQALPTRLILKESFVLCSHFGLKQSEYFAIVKLNLVYYFEANYTVQNV